MTKIEIKLAKQIEKDRQNLTQYDWASSTTVIVGRNTIAAAKRMALRGDVEIIEAQLIDGKPFAITIKL